MLYVNELTNDDDHTDIKGHFHYDDLKKVGDGVYVSYTNDRLVFYQDDNVSKTFTGYVCSASL